MDDIGGVWRTVGGRRIFIKDGQDLPTAMKESGKFKNKENRNQKKDTSSLKEEISIKNSDDVPKQILNTDKQTIENLKKEYKNSVTSINYFYEDSKNRGRCEPLANGEYDIHINNCYNSIEERISKTKMQANTNYWINVDDNNYDKVVLTHEFGHSLVNSNKKGTLYYKIAKISEEYEKEILPLQKSYDDAKNKILFDCSKENIENVYKIQKDYDRIIISKRALEDYDEFIAESFAQAKLSSNPSPYASKVLNLIDEELKK